MKKKKKPKKSKWQLKKERRETKYSQFDPKIHKMSKSGIGFAMKDSVKDKDADFRGAQLKHLFDKWDGTNDKE